MNHTGNAMRRTVRGLILLTALVGPWLASAVLALPASEREVPAAVLEIQARGYQLAQNGDYAGALAQYRSMLEQGAELPDAFVRRTHYAVAQLSFAVGEYEQAVAYLQRWQAMGPSDPAAFAPYILLGQAYFKIDDYAGAIASLETGLDRARASGAVIREDWLALLHHLYVEQRLWPQAVGVLERLAALYPSARYEALLRRTRAQQG